MSQPADLRAKRRALAAARAATIAAPVSMPAHLRTVASTPLRTGTKTRATRLTATQRDSAGRRSDWSRAATLRPTSTPMTRAWSATHDNLGTQYR